jgi:hypothetical protein
MLCNLCLKPKASTLHNNSKEKKKKNQGKTNVPIIYPQVCIGLRYDFLLLQDIIFDYFARVIIKVVPYFALRFFFYFFYFFFKNKNKSKSFYVSKN